MMSPANRTVVAIFLLVVVGAYLWRGQWRRLVAWLCIVVVSYAALLLARAVIAPQALALVAAVLFTLPLFDGVWLLLSGRPLFFPRLLRASRSATGEGDDGGDGTRVRSDHRRDT
ncbi:MAG: hypothetical protein CL878_09085 [Dehalococcoidia bacterium]|nr:hypothetical protein [Dehalococcoidia bacterium]